jgi:hypothetical protein
MAPNERSLGSMLGVVCLLAVTALPAVAADAPAGTVTVVPPANPAPGAAAPLVGLDSGALALVPPGSASAARNEGLAGSPTATADLGYIPPAERDSYLNSRDFADHLQTSQKGGHMSAMRQMTGVAEGMAINGALLGITGLTVGGQ